MKRKIIVLLIVAVVGLTTAFASCGNIETFTFRINLNGGSYTEAYKEANNYTSNNVSHIISPKLEYKKVYDKLPKAGDITPPSGKVLAGWYFDRECSAERIFCESNWAIESQNGGAGAFAHWIDQGHVSITFELANVGASFTDEYKSSLGIEHNFPRFIGTVDEVLVADIPTITDVVPPENLSFGGWYLDSDYNIPLSDESVMASAVNGAGVTLYAKWVNRLEVAVIFFAEYSSDNSSLFNYDEEIIAKYNQNPNFTNEICISVYRDEFDKLIAIAEELSEHIVYSGNGEFAFNGWEIIKWIDGVKVGVDFTLENFLLETESSVGQSFTAIHVEATWVEVVSD